MPGLLFQYLLDLKEWEIQRNKILGDETTPETLTYYNHEKAYLDSELVEDYTKATEERTRIVGDL